MRLSRLFVPLLLGVAVSLQCAADAGVPRYGKVPATQDGIVRALRPGGRVAFVEYRAIDPSTPIKPEHAMDEAQVRREAALHPLQREKTVTDLPRQFVVVFRKRE